MYCPNCGEKESSELALACSKCHMPFDDIAEKVAEHRATAPPEPDTIAGIPKERLIGAAAFLAIAAIPIGFGVKASLQQETPE